MKTSESILAIAPAVVAAQAVMEGAKKDHSNPHFKSKYAGLDSVVEAVKEALTSNGVAYLQFPCTTQKDEVGVETLLLHKSGEWIMGEAFYLPVQRADAQGFGSALTYARRYSLMAACGIAPEDDDGNAAAKAKPDPRSQLDVDAEKMRASNLTGRQEAVDAFAALSPAKQGYCRDQAMEFIARFDDGEELAEWVEDRKWNTETKLAIWSLLHSKVKTEYKRQRNALEQQRAAAQAKLKETA